MDKDEVEFRLYCLGDVQIALRRQIGELEEELKALQKELKETEKEIFILRSTKEYEELVKER